MKTHLLAVGSLSLIAHGAFANPDNHSAAKGTATATIVSPLMLTHSAIATLSFGTFTSASGGSVTVNSAGKGSVVGDVGFAHGSKTSADQFIVTGEPLRSFAITTTSGKISSGSKSLQFTTKPSAFTGTMSAIGTAKFSIGGKLTVEGGTTAGSYFGSYNSIVNYN